MRRTSFPSAALASVLGLTAAFVAGCSGGGHTEDGSSGKGSTTSTTSTTTTTSGAGGGAQASSSNGAGGDLFGQIDGGGGAAALPTSWVNADIGAYARGDAITGDGVADTGVDGSNGCTTLVGVVRDFRGLNETNGDPDFEHFGGSAPTTGLVQIALGTDDKPAYAGRCSDSVSWGCPYGEQLTSKSDFDEWYRYTPTVNQPYLLYLKFVTNQTTNVSTFSSTLFFPLDGAGWGLSGTGDDGKQHNFGFTTEIHTAFKYQGGERFTFTGDDDLWVFINKRLAIDLGGLHPPVSATIDLDLAALALGIQKGSVYPLELFHAERHSSGSNFRVDTDLGFVDCGSILPDPK